MATADDHAPFIAAVCAAPDDDLPRLIYADWLDEYGDPRGEFIRLQCQLAPFDALHPPLTYPDGDPDALRRREGELLNQHWIAWAFPSYSPDWLPGTLGQWACRNLRPGRAGDLWLLFRRGYIEVIMLDGDEWLSIAAAVTAVTPLREVRLTRWPDVFRVYHALTQTTAPDALALYQSPTVPAGGARRMEAAGDVAAIIRGRGGDPQAAAAEVMQRAAPALWPGVTIAPPPEPLTADDFASVTGGQVLGQARDRDDPAAALRRRLDAAMARISALGTRRPDNAAEFDEAMDAGREAYRDLVSNTFATAAERRVLDPLRDATGLDMTWHATPPELTRVAPGPAD